VLNSSRWFWPIFRKIKSTSSLVRADQIYISFNTHEIISSCPVSILLWKARRFGDHNPITQRYFDFDQAADMHSTRGPKHSSEVLNYLFLSSKVFLIHSSMFIHVKPKTLVQSVRFVLFSILDSLVAKHRDGMHPTVWTSLY